MGSVAESTVDFVVPDDDDEDNGYTGSKRKRGKVASRTPSKRPSKFSSQTPQGWSATTGLTPAASRFAFTPSGAKPGGEKKAWTTSSNKPPRQNATTSNKGGKEAGRYQWLVDVRDADGNPPDHPDYDRRTLHIPPEQWGKFSPFEKQYWEIKSKLYDTVVFFKKGKFYELYEDDATIGHQEFDLKLTDRVNMRMVGVPESSLEMWASQFVAKGHKIARVDQRETALGKEMREKDGKVSKGDSIIKRELACVLTGGTLVDEAMLQDEMSTFCVAIKEDDSTETPSFGIAFVDTATGSFSLSEFVDDVDLTKFETFVAQIRPKELILEKGAISKRAIRILKNNTAPTTIWNKLKPEKEFWDASTTVRELNSRGYFGEDEDGWPDALHNVQSQQLVMSAMGALLYYLQSVCGPSNNCLVFANMDSSKSIVNS